MSRRAPDPLAIVEAGYDLAIDDDAWVRRVTHAVAQDIVGPLGTVGYAFAREHPFGYSLGRISVARGEPILGALTRSVVACFPAEDLAAFYRQRGVTTSMESCRTSMPPQSTERGMVDFCGLVVGDEARGVTIGAPLPEATRLSAALRLRWRRISAHLTAVFRLRGALSTGCAEGEEALLSPDARIVHASGAVARSRTARGALRDAVRAMEKARGPLRREDPSLALALWREIVAGRWTIVEKIESCGRRLLVAHANPPDAAPLRELSPTELVILRSLLDGSAPARIASRLGLTRGAVSRHIDRVLRKLRLRSASDLVTTVARLRRPASVSRLDLGGPDALVVDTGPSPEALLASRLTRAERQIASLVLDGLSTAEIADARRRKYRTVANQLASLYEKLGVGSRVELGTFVAKISDTARDLRSSVNPDDP